MIGRHPGRVKSQGEVLSALLEESGYHVRKGSYVLNRYLRLMDIIRTIIKARNSTDVLVLEI